MNIWSLIGQSCALTFQRFGAMAKVFWLPALVWALFVIGSEWFSRIWFVAPATSQASVGAIDPQQHLIAALISLLGVAIYSMVLASGLVRWHRVLIKDAEPVRARFWLARGGEWWFLWRWSWLGAVFLLISSVVFVLLVVVLMFTVGLENAEKIVNGERLTPTIMGLMLGWTFVLAAGLTGRLFPKLTLSLAAIAVGDGEQFRRSGKQSLTSADCSGLALAILATTAPFILGSLVPIMMLQPSAPDVMNAALTPLYIAVTAAGNVISLAGAIVFATMLSLFYRQHVAMVPQAASAP